MYHKSKIISRNFLNFVEIDGLRWVIEVRRSLLPLEKEGLKTLLRRAQQRLTEIQEVLEDHHLHYRIISTKPPIPLPPELSREEVMDEYLRHLESTENSKRVVDAVQPTILGASSPQYVRKSERFIVHFLAYSEGNKEAVRTILLVLYSCNK